ncbi:hypothetical protein EYC84_003286 [Monilinia fructicola]|uniref:Uncharacterized protein n=1 Tax=Monilinia fructicola TaxID=38448 RepID=A0A5M9K1B2_MONFR|nr:hypothetical protein EYC84_003286 [Monilinia fructicola]
MEVMVDSQIVNPKPRVKCREVKNNGSWGGIGKQADRQTSKWRLLFLFIPFIYGSLDEWLIPGWERFEVTGYL